jgi:hypothetical protein
MKYKTKKTITIECSLDGSETVMFGKGGKHQIEISDLDSYSDFDNLIISFQLDRKSQGYVDWLQSEVNAHKERENNENTPS